MLRKRSERLGCIYRRRSGSCEPEVLGCSLHEADQSWLPTGTTSEAITGPSRRSSRMIVLLAADLRRRRNVWAPSGTNSTSPSPVLAADLLAIFPALAFAGTGSWPLGTQPCQQSGVTDGHHSPEHQCRCAWLVLDHWGTSSTSCECYLLLRYYDRAPKRGTNQSALALMATASVASLCPSNRLSIQAPLSQTHPRRNPAWRHNGIRYRPTLRSARCCETPQSSRTSQGSAFRGVSTRR